MKVIVTHLSPDLDALTSLWLVKKFFPGFSKAKIVFVPAGSTYNNKEVDKDKEIIHVDTGFGQFDHHQTTEYTSATKKVFEYLKEKKILKKNQVEPLERLVNQVNDFDHFAQVFYPEATSDYFDFLLPEIIDGGLKSVVEKDEKVVDLIFPLLDALFNLFCKKVKGEKELKKGYTFQSFWGKSLVIETKNEEVLKIALKSGYKLVARKDPEKGNIRIKTLPKKELNLKPLYEKIISLDKKGTWFFHISGNLLLNGSAKNPHFTPSSLTTQNLIKIIKSI